MKKDLNYIAAVEKAIKKKYGSEAIDNPEKFWDEEKENLGGDGQHVSP